MDRVSQKRSKVKKKKKTASKKKAARKKKVTTSKPSGAIKRKAKATVKRKTKKKAALSKAAVKRKKVSTRKKASSSKKTGKAVKKISKKAAKRKTKKRVGNKRKKRGQLRDFVDEIMGTPMAQAQVIQRLRDKLPGIFLPGMVETDSSIIMQRLIRAEQVGSFDDVARDLATEFDWGLREVYELWHSPDMYF